MPRRSGTKRSPSAADGGGPQRLQRLLASAGFGSRRQCEELIESGRVDVDGEEITKLGTTVDPNTQKVRVDGIPLKKQKLVYYAVNKPVGVVTTNRDPKGRPRVVDLVPPDERVFPVGRLDRNSEGLILLTNDGELAQRLTHPKFGVRKIYRVTVAGKVDVETMQKMRKGIYIAEGFVRVDGAKLLKTRGRASELEIVLREGKNREIRRILARLGHKVQQLRRIAVGPLRLGEVPAGAYRVLRREEVDKLWATTDANEAAAAAAGASDEDAAPRRATKKRPGGRDAAPGRRPTGKSAAGRATDKPSGGKPSGGKRAGNKAVATKKTGVKKTARQTNSSPTAQLPLTPRSTGAVIGADPAPPSDYKRSPKSGKPAGKSGKSARKGGPASRRSTGRPAGKRGNTSNRKRKP